MSKLQFLAVVRTAVIALLALLAPAASALVSPILLDQNFDTDTVGSLPAGWSFTSGSGATTYVQNGVPGTPSLPNVFQIEQNSEAFTVATSFAPVNLDPGSPDLVVHAQLRVDELVANDSSGFDMRTWTGVSNIDAGYYRVLSRGAGQFDFYSGNYGANGGNSYTGPYNIGQWYDIMIDYHAITGGNGTSGGTVKLYINGLLANTETYSGKAYSQTHGIDTFQFTSVNTGENRIYLDNLQIDVPEPASVLLLAVGAVTVLRRRR